MKAANVALATTMAAFPLGEPATNTSALPAVHPPAVLKQAAAEAGFLVEHSRTDEGACCTLLRDDLEVHALADTPDHALQRAVSLVHQRMCRPG